MLFGAPIGPSCSSRTASPGKSSPPPPSSSPPAAGPGSGPSSSRAHSPPSYLYPLSQTIYSTPQIYTRKAIISRFCICLFWVRAKQPCIKIINCVLQDVLRSVKDNHLDLELKIVEPPLLCLLFDTIFLLDPYKAATFVVAID